LIADSLLLFQRTPLTDPWRRSEENPDILKETAINRGQVQMSTGMEKEEETVCIELLLATRSRMVLACVCAGHKQGDGGMANMLNSLSLWDDGL
jgi:hypothetical protein